MNIVIYSYNFFPQADPESYCSTRFASSLSRAGHDVTVVTMEWPMQVSEANYNALVDKNINIIRLPFSKNVNTPLKALLWYGHKSQMAVDVKQSVKIVKSLLCSVDNPILITRSMPIAGAMVGLKCHKFAKKWFAHFSDPVPWNGYSNTLGHKLLKRLELNIVKNTFLKADAISVTCSYVKRYFKDTYKSFYNEDKIFVLTHIADYRLGGPIENHAKKREIPIILHTGSMFAHRGGRDLPRVMQSLLKQNFSCKFIQVGIVDNPIKSTFTNTENMEIHDTASLEESLKFCRSANVIFIPDVESDLAYSPVLPSKFVYRIMDNHPIVVYSYRESELYDYSIHYPEAGLFFAEIGNLQSLQNAIKSALECDTSKIDRSRIRKCFSEKTIVQIFENKVNNLLL